MASLRPREARYGCSGRRRSRGGPGQRRVPCSPSGDPRWDEARRRRTPQAPREPQRGSRPIGASLERRMYRFPNPARRPCLSWVEAVIALRKIGRIDPAHRLIRHMKGSGARGPLSPVRYLHPFRVITQTTTDLSRSLVHCGFPENYFIGPRIVGTSRGNSVWESARLKISKSPVRARPAALLGAGAPATFLSRGRFVARPALAQPGQSG